jgi:hypothetical protein
MLNNQMVYDDTIWIYMILYIYARAELPSGYLA